MQMLFTYDMLVCLVFVSSLNRFYVQERIHIKAFVGGRERESEIV